MRTRRSGCAACTLHRAPWHPCAWGFVWGFLHFRVQGLGFKVTGLGFKVWGAGCYGVVVFLLGTPALPDFGFGVVGLGVKSYTLLGLLAESLWPVGSCLAAEVLQGFLAQDAEIKSLAFAWLSCSPDTLHCRCESSKPKNYRALLTRTLTPKP